LLKPFLHWGLLFIQLITATLAIRCWNKKSSFDWKIFIVVWVLTFLVEGTGKILGSYGIHNLWLYNLFYIIFYPGIILLYADVYASNKGKRSAIIVFALCLILFDSFHLLSYTNSNLYTFYIFFASSVILFLALSYLVALFLDKKIVTPLKNDYYYWFSTGFIIYFVFSALRLGMYTRIIESKNSWLPKFTFYVDHLITLVLHFCLWAGFRAAYKWMK